MDSEPIEQSFLAPSGDIASTAGYAASISSSTALNGAAHNFDDPVILSKLTDRVYELLLADLRSQRERVRNYGKRC